MFKKILLSCMIFVMASIPMFGIYASAATDFTQGVTVLSSTQVKIWFKPTTASALVDVHYTVNGGGQQNFRMANNAGTWEQTVSGLTTGSKIDYWFTYEKGGPLFDTAHFIYTHGSVSTPTPTPIPTATPTGTPAPTPTPTGDYTKGVTSLSSTQAKIWFKPTTISTLVDVHYLINGAGQQDFRMTNNNGTWEQTVSGLSNGTVIEYWFTYEKNGPLYVTVHFTYTFSTVADTQAPTAPTGLTSPSKTATSVSLAWTASTDNVGVTGYDVFKAGVLAGSSTTTSFTVTGLTASTAYSFTVKAKDTAGNISAASAALIVTTSAATGDTQAPTAPTGLTSPSKTATSVNLAWTASTDNVGVTGYDVFKAGVLAGSSTTTSFTVTGLTASSAYSFTVKAKDAAGNISAASATLSVTTNAPTVTNGTFPLILQNNTRGIWSNSQIYVMVLGQVVDGQWSYMKADGTVTHINHLDANAPGHLTKNGVNYANMSFTLAQASALTMPTHMRGGRIYISIGSPMYIPISSDDAGWGGPDLLNPLDPNTDVYYDWYEYTYIYGQVTYGGNTTQVDQFGFPMTARLQQPDIGYDKTFGITLTRDQVMSQYSAAVGAAFKPLANTYRIVAPRSSSIFAAATPTAPAGSQANYFQSYIDQVWNYYTANQLILTRLNETFSGRVVNGVMQFTKQGAGPFYLNKPTSSDVVRCAGALAPPTNDTERQFGAEFCAAFNRGVAMNTANWYTPAAYYTNAIQNDYSGFFHSISIDKRAYGFAYDDINDQSSVMILPNSNPPSALTLGIGW